MLQLFNNDCAIVENVANMQQLQNGVIVEKSNSADLIASHTAHN